MWGDGAAVQSHALGAATDDDIWINATSKIHDSIFGLLEALGQPFCSEASFRLAHRATGWHAWESEVLFDLCGRANKQSHGLGGKVLA